MGWARSWARALPWYDKIYREKYHLTIDHKKFGFKTLFELVFKNLNNLIRLVDSETGYKIYKATEKDLEKINQSEKNQSIENKSENEDEISNNDSITNSKNNQVSLQNSQNIDYILQCSCAKRYYLKWWLKLLAVILEKGKGPIIEKLRTIQLIEADLQLLM